MLDEQEADVAQAEWFDVHGVRHVEVTVVYPDGTSRSGRLGAESVPEDLRPGERVFVASAMHVIVGIRRP